jgi:uncharacterized RDD family membrane protein YckC
MSDPSNPFAPSDANPFAGGDAWADPSDLELLKVDRFQRWVGAFDDNLIPMVLVVPLGIGAFVWMGDELARDPDLAQLLFYGVYFVGVLPFTLVNWYLIVDRGQTLGKMAVGTRIVTEDGAPVDFVKGVILRNWVVAVLGSFCGFAGLLDALLIFGEGRQCGHDMIAKTIVVDANAWNPYES